jgi:hypothetical protein
MYFTQDYIGIYYYGRDGLSAIQHIQSPYASLPYVTPDYDLLIPIRKHLNTLPIEIQFLHIRGHQELEKEHHELCRCKKLNIEMGSHAKQAMIHYKDHSPFFSIQDNQGSVWVKR